MSGRIYIRALKISKHVRGPDMLLLQFIKHVPQHDFDIQIFHMNSSP